MNYFYAVLCVNLMEIIMGLPPQYIDESQENEVQIYDFPFVVRSQWQARVPKEKTELQTPVPYVVIHHSYIPSACHSGEACRQAMRSMQDFHMDDRGWWDIGYNFAVGGDGTAYEGRGWNVLGAHSLHFNSVSIGIVLIGDWSDTLPPPEQIKTAKALIDAGVDLGYIKPQYKLIGHRQVRATECPGEALFKNIQTWTHYSKQPSSASELKNVKELPASVRSKLFGNATST